MKRWALIALSFAIGTSHGEPTVQVIGLEGRARDTPAIHLVGGQTVDLELQIASTTPAGAELRANLYQLATGIAAPIAKDLPVAEEGSLADRQKYVLTLPVVRAATTMELRFVWKAAPGEDWRRAGSSRLVVHPADTLNQIRTQLAAATSAAGIKLSVLGESPQLKRVLREADLIDDEADSALDGETAKLSLAECSADAARDLLEESPATARLLIFTSDPTLPPGVYWTERGGGFKAKVTLPVLAEFDRSPDRQLLLLTLVQQALRTFPNTP